MIDLLQIIGLIIFRKYLYQEFLCFMIFIYILSLVYCNQVNVLYGDDPSLHLSVVKASSGGKSVRMISKDKKGNLDIIDEFQTSSLTSPTKLLTPADGYICGKTTDPGVVTCTDQVPKSAFIFEHDGTFVRIKADNGQCLTKMGLDSRTGGFYLNLKNCNGSPEQKFILKNITPFNEDVNPSYGSFEYYRASHFPSSYSYYSSFPSDDDYKMASHSSYSQSVSDPFDSTSKRQSIGFSRSF